MITADGQLIKPPSLNAILTPVSMPLLHDGLIDGRGKIRDLGSANNTSAFIQLPLGDDICSTTLPSTELLDQLRTKMDRHGYVIVENLPYNGPAMDETQRKDNAPSATLEFKCMGMAFGKAVKFENEGTESVVSIIQARGTAGANEISGESNETFPLHTDGSYQKNPPVVMGLYFIQPDIWGEAQTQLVSVDDIIPLLKPEVIDELQKQQFAFPLPKRAIYEGQEKEAQSVIHSVLSRPNDIWNIRFRGDTIKAPTRDAQYAVDALKDAAEEAKICYYTKHGTAIFGDNTRMMHARSWFEDAAFAKRTAERIYFDGNGPQSREDASAIILANAQMHLDNY